MANILQIWCAVSMFDSSFNTSHYNGSHFLNISTWSSRTHPRLASANSSLHGRSDDSLASLNGWASGFSQCSLRDIKEKLACLNCNNVEVTEADDMVHIECTSNRHEGAGQQKAPNISDDISGDICLNFCENCHISKKLNVESELLGTDLLLLAMSIIAVLGNIGSISAVVQFRKRFSCDMKPFHVLLVNLAASNLLVSLTEVFRWSNDVACALNPKCIMPFDTTYMCVTAFSSLFGHFFVLSSIMANVYLVLDQYIGITRPFEYKRIVTERSLKYFIASGWVVSALFSGVPFGPFIFLASPYDTSQSNQDSLLTSLVQKSVCHRMILMKLKLESAFWSSIVSDLFTGFLLFLFLFLAITMYVRIRLIALRSSGRFDLGQSQLLMRKKLKLNVTIAIIGGTLVICWLPGVLSRCLRVSMTIATPPPHRSIPPTPEFYDVLVHADRIYTYTKVMNCMLDPLLYGLRLSEVRKGYKALFGVI